MHPELQSPFTGKRRARKYGSSRLALPSPSGGIGSGSTRASFELIADLRALIDGGLIKPSLDGSTVRYAPVDVNNPDPTADEDVR